MGGRPTVTRLCQDVSVLNKDSQIDGERWIRPAWLRPRRRRTIGGSLVLVGLVGMVVAAVYPSWVDVHIATSAKERQIVGDDTVSRTLGQLSARDSTLLALGLVVVATAMALARNDRVRRASGIMAVPALALAVVAVLNTSGIIRLWGGGLMTQYPLTDQGMPTSLASGPWWAITATAAVTAGVLFLASAPPPPNRMGPRPEAR